MRLVLARRAFWMVVALPLGGTPPAVAQLAPVSLPLGTVMALAKPYPNLLFEVRAELVRANLRTDDVTCSGERYPGDWGLLSGAPHAPYQCRIGRRTLIVRARQTVFDRNGHKLGVDDAQARNRAVKLVETGLHWRWR